MLGVCVCDRDCDADDEAVATWLADPLMDADVLGEAEVDADTLCDGDELADCDAVWLRVRLPERDSVPVREAVALVDRVTDPVCDCEGERA